MPTRQRAAFVAMAVKRAAPFGDPEFDVLWAHDQAAVWYWSRDRVRSLGGGTGRKRAEAMFRGDIPPADRVELLDLHLALAAGESISPGVEARVWRGGRLVASRWWAQRPDAPGWRAFARGAGLDASLPCPEATPSPVRQQPLERGSRHRIPASIGAQGPLLAATTAAIVLALFAWQAAGAMSAAWRTHRVESEIARLESSMDRILDARERADAARSRIDALLALRPPASQTRLLGEVKRVTPAGGELMVWNTPSVETLEVTFSLPNADVAAMVTAWEGSPLFQQVAPVSGPGLGDVTLQATLTPILEQPQ